MGLGSQDYACEACGTCSNNTWASGGCDGSTKPVECTACSVCPGDALLDCTPQSDTLCSNLVSCRKNVNYTKFEWVTQEETCLRGKYLYAYDPITKVIDCRDCPNNLVGNGLWCEYCRGFRVPYWDSTYCVCHKSTSSDEDGNCLCGPGREFGESGCRACPVNTFSTQVLTIQNEWWLDYMECEACAAGNYSLEGATGCVECPFGMFRGEQDAACRYCEQGYYATNTTTGESCSACNTSCNLHEYAVDCPNWPGFYVCELCEDIPNNSHRIKGLECDWRCDEGFYLDVTNGTCAACDTNQTCPPGFQYQNCTSFAQSNCDQPCDGAGLPTWNAEYYDGCNWRCVQGYRLITKNYGLWTETQCIEEEARLFWWDSENEN